LNAAGQLVFCSFISPEAGPRDAARATHESAG
jgi:adenylylsulfate kinase-like enzyme